MMRQRQILSARLALALLLALITLSACSSTKPTELNNDAPIGIKIDESQLNQVISDNLTRHNRTLFEAIDYQTQESKRQYLLLIQQLKHNSETQTLTPITLSSIGLNESATPANSKPIVGELEHVFIDILQASFIARIDTGQIFSSLSVHNLIPFRRNGSDWIRFDIYTRGPQAPAQSFESKIERFERIGTLSADSENSSQQNKRLPVIYSKLQIGQHSKNAELLLVEQTQSSLLVLGRHFLKGFALIDTEKKYNLGGVSP